MPSRSSTSRKTLASEDEPSVATLIIVIFIDGARPVESVCFRHLVHGERGLFLTPGSRFWSSLSNVLIEASNFRAALVVISPRLAVVPGRDQEAQRQQEPPSRTRS